MPSIFKYIIGRLFFALVTVFALSIALFGIIYMAPLDMRISLFMPGNIPLRILLDEDEYNKLRGRIIEQNHLSDPFPTQYGIWASNFFSHNWGWSPSLGSEVLPAILDRTPATAELTVYSMALIIPLSLLSGVYAAKKKDKPTDFILRGISMGASAVPLFVMAFFLMTIFYINLKWSSLSGLDTGLLEASGAFRPYTGLITVDGILNGRMDITLTAFRHLLLPVITIVLSQWALLTRITRSTTIEELQKEYTIAAKARGASPDFILWRHVIKNTLSVFLANTAMSAASLITGVFIVERIFLWPGVSSILFRSGAFIPDSAAVIGFTIYSVMVVLFIMLVLDILQAAVNPLVSEEMIGGSNGQ